MSDEEWTLGMRGQVLLTKSPNWFGEREKMRERGERKGREIFLKREALTSL